MRPRYTLIEVERHGGRQVAVVLDQVTGETKKVYRRGTRYLLWNKHDVRVENAALRRVAREAFVGVGV